MRRSSWFRPKLSPTENETAVWYCDQNNEEDATDSDVDTIKNFLENEEENEDDCDTSLSSASFLSLSMPRLTKEIIIDSDADATDGSISSYFGTLPKATRRLFRSDLYLNKSETNLRQHKLPDNWLQEDVFDPGLFGLLENPGVLRMDFDDYPDSVFESMEQSNVEEEGDFMDADEEKSSIVSTFVKSLTFPLDRVILL